MLLNDSCILQKKKRAAEPDANGAAEQPEQKKKKKKSAAAAETVADTANTLAALAESTLPVQEEEDGAEAVDPTEKKKKKKKKLAEDPGAAEGQSLCPCLDRLHLLMFLEARYDCVVHFFQQQAMQAFIAASACCVQGPKKVAIMISVTDMKVLVASVLGVTVVMHIVMQTSFI